MGEAPAKKQRNESQEEPEQTGSPAPKTITEDAQDRAKQRAAQQRYSGEKPFLRGGEVELFAKKRSQRAKQNPNHEAHVKIEKSRDQSWKVAGFQEVLCVHYCTSPKTERLRDESRAIEARQLDCEFSPAE